MLLKKILRNIIYEISDIYCQYWTYVLFIMVLSVMICLTILGISPSALSPSPFSFTSSLPPPLSHCPLRIPTPCQIREITHCDWLALCVQASGGSAQ